LIEAKDTLKIVNASAGSGKTYSLVREYILLLIKENYTTNFSGVIAMTFTNKAAIEMKERIIKGLYSIGKVLLEGEKQTSLTQEIASEAKLNAQEVQQRCRLVLQAILHQYEDFHVMTIDKFNLRLIRSFGKDLDIANDFEVVLEESEVIEQIVDDLLNQLGEENNNDLNKLIFKYAEANLEEGNSWNIRRKLVNFGKILTREKNKDKVVQLLDVNFSVEQYGLLHTHRKQMDATFMIEADKIFQLFNSGEIDESSLPGKSKTQKRIRTITKSETFFLGNELFTKSYIETLEHDSFPSTLKAACYTFLKFWSDSVQEYAALKLFLNNFFNMALLQFMAKALEKLKKEEQLILISEFNSLISKLIQAENTPFIYERLGTRYKHFLLDEFQDTSHMQWLNLVPLIHESLGNGNENLIVGDPKQSIYRFKNGLAEQFITLPRIYNPDKDKDLELKSNYFNAAGQLTNLDDNYRSSPVIVEFNNEFFKNIKSNMPRETVNYYKSIFQNPKSTLPGRVEISSSECKIEQTEIIDQLIDWVKQCKTDGFNYGDLCILGNINKDCNQWAIGLTNAGYRVVSSDSLLIDSDLTVQLTISFLKWRLKSNENDKKQFSELFFRLKEKNYDTYQQYIVERKGKNDKTFRFFDDTTFLNTHFQSYAHFFFKYESIYDLIQGFYRLMNFNELENSYLHHLADIVFEFELKRGPNLRGFLEDYQRHKQKIAVQIPESNDAIKIMTIHKSKGLEFPVVMMPTLNFKIKVKNTFLVQSDDYLIYKVPSQNEVLDTLRTIYSEELTQVETDFINLCYVGMTRPVERLYILNKFEKNTFGEVFHAALEPIPEVKTTDKALNINLGSRKREQRLDYSSKSILFEPKNVKDNLWFPDISLQDHSRLGLSDYLSKEMQFGIQFHLLASRIEHIDDLDQILENGIKSGEIEKINASELKVKLSRLIYSSDYQDLFSDKKMVLNEQAILVDENTVVIPDKIIVKENETIIIDYKTGLPENKDIKQIIGYKDVLEDMSYPNVKCYLYYSSIEELRLVG